MVRDDTGLWLTGQAGTVGIPADHPLRGPLEALVARLEDQPEPGA